MINPGAKKTHKNDFTQKCLGWKFETMVANFWGGKWVKLQNIYNKIYCKGGIIQTLIHVFCFCGNGNW